MSSIIHDAPPVWTAPSTFTPRSAPAVVTASAVATVLRAAANHIETYGLNKNGFVARSVVLPIGRRSMCVVGAIRWAAVGDPEQDDPALVGAWLARTAVGLVSDRLPGSPPDTNGVTDPVEHVAAWSDADERTAADVASMLRRCALAVAGAVL